jgi:membrane protein implicated in regulation of membrane protease activity
MDILMIDITYWHWIGLAITALIIEVITGTGFLLWIGSSAAIVALLVFLFHTMPLGLQFILFSVLAILSALAWKYYLHRHAFVRNQSTLNRRAEQYIGRTFTLNTPIVNGLGTIHVDDSMWRIHCAEDLAPGEKVRVTQADGVFLVVEKEAPKNQT